MTVHQEQIAARSIEAGSYEDAIRLLLPLAEQRSEYALLTLGWIYETGALGAPDKNAARSYYQRAAATGSASAYHSLGWLFMSDGYELQARSAFETGAVLDDDDCKSALARLADYGDEQIAAQSIETESYDDAVRLLLPLAERNSEYALLVLGWIHETGALGAPDKDAARSYYERAVAEGSAPACHYLGCLFLDEEEEMQARAALETGAERGDVPAMSVLGMMMVKGLGGAVDIDAGTTWLETAKASGNFFAQRTLLGIEGRNARSVFGKLAVAMKIAALARDGVRELWKDPHSDKLR